MPTSRNSLRTPTIVCSGIASSSTRNALSSLGTPNVGTNTLPLLIRKFA